MTEHFEDTPVSKMLGDTLAANWPKKPGWYRLDGLVLVEEDGETIVIDYIAILPAVKS